MLEAKIGFAPKGWRAAASYLNAAKCKADKAWHHTLCRKATSLVEILFLARLCA